MRKIISVSLFFTLSFIISFNIYSQNVVKGVVVDDSEGFGLPYAQVKVNGNGKVILTDAKGNYRVESHKDTCQIEVFYGGYQTFSRMLIFRPDQKEMKVDIKMVPQVLLLDAASVVSSKYETNPEKATNSIVVLNPKQMENKNIITVDALLNTAGGVAVVDNEPQIRGGSGFSSGMGSRVMILLDYIPLLRPDAGRPMWNFIPMEDVEQVEILKGAASVVFGSSALTGAINVLTAYPRVKPKTKVTLFAGMYSDPNESYRTSWIHNNPVKWGASFLHSRIIKKNFDLVIGGEFFDDQGHIGPEEKIAQTWATNGDDRGKYERRGRLNFATRYRFSKVKGLSVSLNANAMYTENAQSFFWYNADTNMYRTYPGSMSKFKDVNFYVDPTIQYIAPKGSIHSFRNRITYSDSKESKGLQSSNSVLVFNEYQYNKQISKIGMDIVAGIMNIYAESFGPVFNGDNYSSAPKRMFSDNFALYAQLEQKFLKKKNLIVALGGRWEYYQLDDINENEPIFRAGVNYQIPKTKTAFRASFGQGYRYPSIGEKFIALTVGRYGFYPNPDLVSETSQNIEVGAMQPFSFFDFKGIVDLALYRQDYDNYIEFCMGAWGTEEQVQERMGFKFLNTGSATISGIDFNLMGEGKISKNVTYTLMASYTYSNPVANKRDEVYHTYMNKDYTFLNTSSDTSRSVLKYRIEHMAKFDLEFTFYKKFSFGVSGTYYSAMKNVDLFFFDYDIHNPNLSARRIKQLKAMGDLPFEGYYNYFNSKDYQNGSFVFDVRASFIIKDVTLSLIVKNILNKSYTLRPMYVEPTRTFTVQAVYNLN